MIATFLPRSVIDSLYTVMKKVGLRVNNITLEPIAAIEAVVPRKLRLLNIALVDIGAGTSDIAISSKESISSYGMVPQAGDEITEVIAQECLVDFNTAEYIKRNLSLKENITYTDILGLENTISSENLLKVVRPAVRKIAEAISVEIIELNAGKAPSALFLIGGGAHTPWIVDELSIALGIPVQRIVIKDRTAIEECISSNDLGSAGVTVLGIALMSIKQGNNDFIEVILNGTPVTMLNSHNHKVMDVIIHAGVNPNMILVKNGKNLRYKVNNVKRIAFGERGKNPIIKVNGKLESLEKVVSTGDIIEIEYAIQGKDANPRIIDQIKEFNTVSFYLDEKLVNLEPIILVNDEIKTIEYLIQENDNISIILPKTIGDIKKHILKNNINIKKNGALLDDNYIVVEGDKFSIDNKENNYGIESKKSDANEINVTFNSKLTTLKGQKEYIFVNIFNYVDFNLKDAKGIINLKLNGNKVGYTEKINDGDNIEVYWT